VNIQFILVSPDYHQSPPQPLLPSFEPKSLEPGLHQIRLRLKQLGTRHDPRSKQLLGGRPQSDSWTERRRWATRTISKKKATPGPNALRLKLKGNWRDLVNKSLSKKKSAEGWPK